MQEIVVSSVLFGALFGSLIGGFFIDKYGRRSSIIFSSLLYCIGGIVLSAAQTYPAIIIGRILLGVAMALAAASECVYVSELAPQAIRGSLVSLNEFGITFGILFSYVINVAFASNMLNGWRYMFGLSTVIAVFVLICVTFLPKSPRYLLMSGEVAQAQTALFKVRLSATEHQKQLVLQEFDSMQSSASVTTKGSFFQLCNRLMVYPLTIAAGLVIFQQSSGEPNVLFYAKTILTAVGFHSDISATVGTVGLGVSKVVATVICLMIVDKLGRRRLLMAGCIIMFFTIFSVSIIAFQFEIEGEQICKDNDTVQFSSVQNQTASSSLPVSDALNVNSLKWFALTMLIVFVAAYSISFGPVTWIVLSEIFPRELRGRLFSFATLLNWGMNLLISSTFLGFAQSTDGLGWPFMFCAIFCIFATAFVYFIVPETKGKSLEDVTAVLNKGLQCKCSRCFFTKTDDTALLIAEEA